VVASGLGFPVFLTAPPGDAGRLFIVDKAGYVRIVKGGALLPTPFLDIHALVTTDTEQGLLGLAFDPLYAVNGRFFVDYTDLDGNTRVVRFQASANPDMADPGAADTVITVNQPASNHNGGMVAFGPDGYLYVGLGDGGGANDQFGTGQTKNDLLASILRLDVNGPKGYMIPVDNPFSPPDRRELWDYGLRNPWRFSFDRANGDLYIGDVGQDSREEIDVAPRAAGGGRGANYGWSIMEGMACFPPGRNCSSAGLTRPVLDYDHTQGCAVTGGYVYRGSAIPELQGTYFYADFCFHWVRSFRYANGAPTSATDWPTLDPGFFVTSFGQDATGELYILTENGVAKKIVRG
jgi:glucose/arabinose dehydrogenase